jgi:hypothetical protein
MLQEYFVILYKWAACERNYSIMRLLLSGHMKLYIV